MYLNETVMILAYNFAVEHVLNDSGPGSEQANEVVLKNASGQFKPNFLNCLH